LGIVKRQTFFNTLTHYIGIGFGFLNIVVLFPLLLSDEEFGLTRLVISMATTMAHLSSFGVQRIAIKFFPIFRKEPHKNNGLLMILLALSAIGFIAVTGLYFLFRDTIIFNYSDESSLFSNYYIWVPLSSLGLLAFIVFESFLQALRKTVFSNILKNIVIRVFWLAGLLMYYFDLVSFFSFMIIYMMSYFFIAAFCIAELIKIGEFTLDVNSNYLRKRIINPILNFGLYTMLSGTTLILVTSIDQLMIGALMPEDKLVSVGIYAIATYIVSIINIPTISLTRISAPIVAYDWRKRNLHNIEQTYKRSSVILIFLGGIIFGCIALNIDDFLALFLKPEYAAAKPIIIILGITRLFDMAAGINLVILVTTRFQRVEALLAVFLLVLVIVTNFIFIPIYGIIGAAIGTTVVFFFFNVTVFIFIWVKLNMQPYSMATLKMVLFGLAAAGITWILPLDTDNAIFNIILRSSVFVLLYFIPVYLLKVSPDINEVINKKKL
jgi:O-antigen/teichoic acid export membrane protein